MSEMMTVEEIKARFDSKWVLLENPVTTKKLEVKRDKILGHSKNRDEVYRKAKELRPKHSAILYTGQIPDEMVIVL